MSGTAIPPDDRVMTRKSFAGTGIGNALEWYDWGIYSTLTAFIASHMFSKADPTSALLSTLAVFAVGFLARPVGGLLFGRIADRRGRKLSLMLSVGLASVGSLIIGVTPTFDQIGVWASLLLLAARLMQGLAHGGELPAAQTYLTEKAPAARRGLWSSWIYFSGTVGNLAGLLLAALLTTTLGKESMNDWGWRVPFLVGAVIGLYALVLRRSMTETEVFTEDVEERGAGQGLWASLGEHKKQAAQVIGMTMGATVIYYVWAINAPAYAQTTLKIDPTSALWAGVVGNVVFLVCLPFWGMLSDRIGRKPVLLTAMVGAAVLYIPMNALLKDSAWQLAVTMSIMLAVISAYSAIGPAVYAEMFPTHVRATGFGFPYSIAIALFGGTAPLIQAWMAEHFQSTGVFPFYAIALMVVSGVTILSLPETKGIDLHEVARPDEAVVR
jgi:MHS family alpha-ketoglutarate permease-like MFS transporter